MNIGRCRRAFSARSTAPRPMIGSELAVQRDDDVELVQARRQVGEAASPRRRSARPAPRRARSVRLATAMRLAAGAPRSGSRRARSSRRRRRTAPWSRRRSSNSCDGQAHRGGGHADRVGADLGRGAHFLGDRERALEQLVQRACRACRRCSASRTASFIWPRICGSPSTIESSPLATRNAWRAADGAFEHVGVRAQRRRRHAADAGQPVDAPASTALARRRRVDLGAVAGRDDRDLARPARGATRNALQRRRQLLRRERETAAQIERRGRVVEPQGEDAHRQIIKFALRAPQGLAPEAARRLLASHQLLRAGARSSAAASPPARRKLLWRRELGRRRLAPLAPGRAAPSAVVLDRRPGRLRPRRQDGHLRGDGRRLRRSRSGGRAFATRADGRARSTAAQAATARRAANGRAPR